MFKKIKILSISIAIIILSSFSSSELSIAPTYDSNYVMASSITHNNEKYVVIYLKRKDKRVRAKYFAFKLDGKSVYNRYKEWAENKDKICYTSGTYMDGSYDANTANLVGITIDNGKVVNKTVESTRMDGLVIVYPHGGIAVSDLREGNLKLSGGGANTSHNYDIRNNTDKERFIDWAKSQRATVFQTHLLAYRNELSVGKYNSNTSNKRERRFLAIGKDPSGQVIHCIVHKPESSNLYDAGTKVLEYLQTRKRMEVIALLNLDTGAQDVFGLYTKSGNKNSIAQGQTELSNARNLLVYYFE